MLCPNTQKNKLKCRNSYPSPRTLIIIMDNNNNNNMGGSDSDVMMEEGVSADDQWYERERRLYLQEYYEACNEDNLDDWSDDEIMDDAKMEEEEDEESKKEGEADSCNSEQGSSGSKTADFFFRHLPHGSQSLPQSLIAAPLLSKQLVFIDDGQFSTTTSSPLMKMLEQHSPNTDSPTQKQQYLSFNDLHNEPSLRSHDRKHWYLQSLFNREQSITFGARYMNRKFISERVLVREIFNMLRMTSGEVFKLVQIDHDQTEPPYADRAPKFFVSITLSLSHELNVLTDIFLLIAENV